MTHDLVTQIATDLDPSNLTYDNGKSICLSLPRIYKMLAIWIRIYGEQHKPFGVQKGERPLRNQLEQYHWEYAVSFPNSSPVGGTRFMEIFTTHFLFDSRYSKQLSHNFRAILRGIGDVVAGDEKLLHFTGLQQNMFMYFINDVIGRSPDVRAVLSKPDRVGLWVYELCVKLSNKAPYMLDLWLHDAISILGESIPVSKVVMDGPRSFILLM